MPKGERGRVPKLTLVCADNRVEVPRELAARLADYLWRGVLPGSALGAAKLTDALAGGEGNTARARAVAFEHYEWQAIRGALDALAGTSSSTFVRQAGYGRTQAVPMSQGGFRVRLSLALLAAVAALMLGAPAAAASPYARFGVQDDAWLAYGGGTLERRLALLERMGVSLVRFTLRWDQIAPARPGDARNPDDPAYAWEPAASVLEGLRARGITAVVGIWGTPGWANGDRAAAWAPTSKWSLASFATAAQRRFPWVRHWLIWNEPNRTRWLRPTSPRVYTRLLNVAYDALHRANPRAIVAGGVTAPRGGRNGVSPVAWLRGMHRYRAKLDAYAHNPYPAGPTETPWRGGCSWRRCETITMATLERLLIEARWGFGARTRIWLTEYGYQTNPPDRLWGVSPSRQARYVGSAARRVYRAARVDMLIHFMVRDDTHAAGWQSGFLTTRGSAKPAFRAYMLPLAQSSRRGVRTVLWGQVRPRAGRQPYRLQQRRGGRWHTVGGTYRTSPRGFLRRIVRAGPGARLRLWSPRDRTASPVLVVR